MKNPKTGELKAIGMGWSWILFLFSGWLGIPLFLRKLYMLGGIMAGWSVFSTLLWMIPRDQAVVTSLSFLITFANIGLAVWLGLKGNEYTAKSLLERGWVFTQPDALETKFALSRWGIELPAAGRAF